MPSSRWEGHRDGEGLLTTEGNVPSPASVGAIRNPGIENLAPELKRMFAA